MVMPASRPSNPSLGGGVTEAHEAPFQRTMPVGPMIQTSLGEVPETLVSSGSPPSSGLRGTVTAVQGPASTPVPHEPVVPVELELEVDPVLTLLEAEVDPVLEVEVEAVFALLELFDDAELEPPLVDDVLFVEDLLEDALAEVAAVEEVVAAAEEVEALEVLPLELEEVELLPEEDRPLEPVDELWLPELPLELFRPELPELVLPELELPELELDVALDAPTEPVEAAAATDALAEVEDPLEVPMDELTAVEAVLPPLPATLPEAVDADATEEDDAVEALLLATPVLERELELEPFDDAADVVPDEPPLELEQALRPASSRQANHTLRIMRPSAGEEGALPHIRSPLARLHTRAICKEPQGGASGPEARQCTAQPRMAPKIMCGTMTVHGVWLP
jgi:hypothetical protein